MNVVQMASPLLIDRSTGSISLGDLGVLQTGEQKAAVEPQVRNLVYGSRDHGNGYEWLHLHGLVFGSRPARLSLCFHNALLKSASWSVQLPGAPTEGGWPTREAIDAEVAFVRRTLAEGMGIHTGSFPWGEVWSSFDAKGFLAANGLRYCDING